MRAAWPRAKAAVVACVVCAACARPRAAAEPSHDFRWLTDDEPALHPPIDVCEAYGGGITKLRDASTCALPRREVRAFGPVPRERAPAGRCPVKVRAFGDELVAEARTVGRAFDPLPFASCVPTKYIVGARHVIELEDGWLVAYESPLESEVRWYEARGRDGTRLAVPDGGTLVSRARIVGFVRAPSGVVLGLAIGRARGARGAVVAFERSSDGNETWALRLVSLLPLEPAPAMGDDRGAILGYAGGFVFRADERGAIENLHYVAHDIGPVASIARLASGAVAIGLECGVLKLSDNTETWWSARDGASGRWSECNGASRPLQGVPRP